MRGGESRLKVGFQPLMVISPTASWIRWCMRTYISVVDNTLIYNVTAFNGSIINQEHDIISVLIFCGTDKCMFQNKLSIYLSFKDLAVGSQRLGTTGLAGWGNNSAFGGMLCNVREVKLCWQMSSGIW